MHMFITCLLVYSEESNFKDLLLPPLRKKLLWSASIWRMTWGMLEKPETRFKPEDSHAWSWYGRLIRNLMVAGSNPVLILTHYMFFSVLAH